MFALVDCNNFYASCERVFRPNLNGKPIVVLSNNDGCVIARSNEAKALNIPMGAPAFEFKEVFKKHHVTVFSANFTLYGDMSNRVMNLLEDFSPEIEIYSIDEAFLKFTGFKNYNLEDYGKQIVSKVTQSTGIPISIGFAPTKALSKLANRIAKKYPEKTGGVYVIDDEEKRIKALKWVKVEDLWGIGRQLSKKLYAKGVITGYDFTLLSDQWVKKNLNVIGLRLKHDLQGIPTLDLEEIQSKKSIATTRTFEANYTEFDQLKERISSFAVHCAEKLRKQHSCCTALMVFVRGNRHRKDLVQYSNSVYVQLPFPTNSSIELSKFAISALEQIFVNGYAYKKAGVIVSEFCEEHNTQISLFENSNARHVPLMKAVDQLNGHFGQQKVRLATQDSNRIWKMKQENVSPKYTTKLSDIITIKV